MEEKYYRSPRLNVDISVEQSYKLRELIPHGMKKPIFNVIIDQLINIMEDKEKRDLFIGLVLDKQLSIPDTLVDSARKGKEKKWNILIILLRLRKSLAE